MESLGTIYKIENLVNGKVYIGQTAREYSTRMYEHEYKLRNNAHYNIALQNAWNKYGKNNFTFEIIVRCSINKIDELEQKHIKYYVVQRKAYNISPGGNKIKKLSESTKQKIGKQSMRPVILLNTGEVFVSLKDASEKRNVLSTGITDCCRRNRGHAGRLPNGDWMVWRYKDEYDENEKVSFKKHTDNNKKEVICINTNEIFISGKEAGDKYGINPKNITSCCRDERKSCISIDGSRLQFSYYEENKQYNQLKLDTLHTENKAIICKNTNETFGSIYQASKKYSIDVRRLSNCCKGRYTYAGSLKNGTKLKWEYV